jgi:uncharacterized repeat protein (TIGR01451 family)
VQIVKTAPETVPEGETFEYTLEVVNYGPGTADGVTVTDRVNDDLTVVSVPSGCTTAGRTVTCVVGILGPGDRRLFTITVRAPAPVPVDTDIENCASVSSTTPQVSEADKESCSSTTVVPDLSDIAAVTVLGVPGGCPLAGQTLTCDIGTLAAGATRTFTVTAIAECESGCCWARRRRHPGPAGGHARLHRRAAAEGVAAIGVKDFPGIQVRAGEVEFRLPY